VRSPVRARQNRDLGRPGKEKPSERTALPAQPDDIPRGQKSFDLLYRGTRVARIIGKRWPPPLQNLSVGFTLILLALSYPVYLSLGMRKELPANVSDAVAARFPCVPLALLIETESQLAADTVDLVRPQASVKDGGSDPDAVGKLHQRLRVGPWALEFLQGIIEGHAAQGVPM
jgi:hypothetical protein